ncbi:MAG: Mfa1 fimbrilin C-terminal domain-containing protein [Bacteroidales bacterium]|nr:Mfa1 fimbrilin C-terminal domain-containing protein [Bacteroidales bacterium]
MNYNHLLFAVFAGAALVGCQQETAIDNNGSEQNGDKRYMGFSISMPSATKAAGTGDVGSYVNGEDYENAIKSIYFFFYKDNSYVSSGYGDMKGTFKEDLTNSDPSVEEYIENKNAGKGVVVLESTQAMPNKVLCVINSRNPQWYRNKSFETVKAALHSGTAESLSGNTSLAAADGSFKDFQNEDGGNPYFVMITSPMWGKDAAGNLEVKYASDIFVEETTPGSGKFTADSYIQHTRELAEAKPLEIYVERMAARFDIDNLKKVADGGILKDDGTNFVDPSKMDKSLKKNGEDTGAPLYDIEYLAWSVTAANKKAYSLKHIDPAWFTQLGTNQPFNGGWLQSGGVIANPLYPGGTETMNTRINWAFDPNYVNSTANPRDDNDAYPHSARELLDVSEQKYWSATEVAANYAAAEKSQLDILQRYSYENTFDKKGQASPRVNGTMLLLYAQVKKAGATAYEDLYAYMGQMLTAKQYAWQILSTMASHGYTFYIEDSGNYKALHKIAEEENAPSFTGTEKVTNSLTPVKSTKVNEFYGNNKASYEDKSAKTVSGGTTPLLQAYPDMVVDLTGGLKAETFEPNFAVTWPISKEEKKYANGYVTLIPSASMPKLYVEDTTPGTYREATDAEIAEGFLNGVVEPANKYTEGKMYYAIPIEHYGKANDGATEPNLLEGNYGVVRNNFYKVSIGTIKSLGHGIDDVDEPIVPGESKKPYYLAAKINILSWQLVTQTADLEE